MDPTPVLFQKLAISLVLGLLVGLQRQHVGSGTAGLRTEQTVKELHDAGALLLTEQAARTADD